MTSLTGCARPVKIDKFFTALLIAIYIMVMVLYLQTVYNVCNVSIFTLHVYVQ